MLRHVRGRLTYANVAATLALFIALGGTGYAAVAIPANSVGTSQLKNHAVTAQKVANHTLTGQQINLSKLGTVPSADTARTATNAKTATNAGTAANARALGGLAPASYYQAAGSAHNTLVTVNGGASESLGSIPGWGRVSATCDSTCSVPTLKYTNTTTTAQSVDYYTCGGTNDFGLVTVAPGAAVSGITVGNGDGYNGSSACDWGIYLWSTVTKTQAAMYGGATVQPSGAQKSAFSTELETYS